jgi:hypothetical protein
MVRKIKSLGLVLTAIAALGATAASAAQAGEFTAEEYPATIKGTQTTKHQFQFDAGTVNCIVASFDSKLAAESSTLTIGASYSECTTPGGSAVTVKMNSCDYTFHAGETLANSTVDGSMDVQCAQEGDEIEFEEAANGCVVKIRPQNGLGTLRYTNRKEAKDFDVDIEVNGLQYTQNANCPGEAGLHLDGEYAGQSTMKGSHEGVFTGTTVD